MNKSYKNLISILIFIIIDVTEMKILSN